MPVAAAARTATIQFWLPSTMSLAMTAAHAPLATPADRSISPSSSTNTRPMARIVTGSACTSRLAMLPLLRNVSGRSA